MNLRVSKVCKRCSAVVVLAEYQGVTWIEVRMDVEMFHCGHCLAPYPDIIIRSEIVEETTNDDHK